MEGMHGDNTSKWIGVKEFMRRYFNFNDLNFFLLQVEQALSKEQREMVIARDSQGNSLLDGLPWKNDGFFPLSPESNKIYIEHRFSRSV